GEFPIVDNLDGTNVGSRDDIEDALNQLSEHGNDQGGVRPSPDLEERRKKRHERDVDEGDPSSKKCRLDGS
ncbi:hypothetical protein A2U01_0112047, partial [Trifolium medium]|nr:hypothetical protein [Trifolium medium]